MTGNEHMVGRKRTSFHTEITNVIRNRCDKISSRCEHRLSSNWRKWVWRWFHGGRRGFASPLTSAHRLSPFLLQPAWRFFSFPTERKKKKQENKRGRVWLWKVRVWRCRSGAQAGSMRWTDVTEQTCALSLWKKVNQSRRQCRDLLGGILSKF